MPTTSSQYQHKGGTRQPVKVYLDANVLAAGFVRTLLLLCGPVAEHRSIWSLYAEQEAARHQPAGAVPISTVRELHHLTIVPDRRARLPLVDTSDKDTPILAAASAAKAEFVVTENVKDFGRADLEALSMSAVHPDMFLTTRVTDEEYCFVLESIAERRQRDPRTPAAIHAAEAPNKLPRLFLAHRDRFRLDPKIQPGNPARVQFRGARCVLCATISKKPDVLINGLCQLCLGATAG